eukprot:CAMPEP_0183410120 /NCGR_PEP_ID=MMETSP0370-20130417/19353_1 /TAXON_ID=268820 /ORGANISM="Peridinium aciculiferum, Strain PAER-2" /LENGTH=182 /DNA_ID=CAMNT_0025592917 /DNA_START=59 /DNA_END=607 /DNA_ORIENTATION=-
MKLPRSRARVRRGAGALAVALCGAGLVDRRATGFVAAPSEARLLAAARAPSSTHDVVLEADVADERALEEVGELATAVLPRSWLVALPLLALLLGVVVGGAEPALALPPPEEETQGYLQNFKGYFNLIINFFSGIYGVYFGALQRQMKKQTGLKYLVIAGVLGFVYFILWTVSKILVLDGGD